MVSTFILLIIAFTVVAGSILLTKYGHLRKVNYFIQWMGTNIRIYLDIFEAKKQYKDITLVAIKYSVLLEAINSGLHSGDNVKEWTSKFIRDTHKVMGHKGLVEEQSKAIAFSIGILINQRQELLQIISSFSNHEDIEVKKATVVAIDTLGELYNLRSSLDRMAFKHIIYALNKCLILLRDGGYNKKTYSKVGLTLNRLRVIMKSYNTQKASKGSLTVKQLHKKLATVMGTLDQIIK